MEFLAKRLTEFDCLSRFYIGPALKSLVKSTLTTSIGFFNLLSEPYLTLMKLKTPTDFRSFGSMLFPGFGGNPPS